jgi:hypothetical protein
MVITAAVLLLLLLPPPAVKLPDGSTQHFNLRQQAYKVNHDHSTRDSSGRSVRRVSEPPSAVATAGPGPADSTGPGPAKKQKQAASPSSTSNASAVSKGAAAAAAAGGPNSKGDRKPAAGEGARADGSSKPPRRAAADRAAAVAVAVSMGGNGGNHGREGQDDKDSTGVLIRRPTGATPKGAPSGGVLSAAAVAASKRLDAAAAEAARKLPPLNMSHVSKKDREAARMLLAFNAPAAPEVRAGCVCWGGAGLWLWTCTHVYH